MYHKLCIILLCLPSVNLKHGRTLDHPCQKAMLRMRWLCLILKYCIVRCCLISRFYRVIVCDDNVIVCDNVTSSHFICNGTLGSVVHLLSVMSYICGTSGEDDGYAKNFNCPRCSLSCAMCSIVFIQTWFVSFNHSSSTAVLATCTELSTTL